MKKIKHIWILILGFATAIVHYTLYVLDNIITVFSPHPRPSLKTFSNTPLFQGDALIRVCCLIFVYLLVIVTKWLLI